MNIKNINKKNIFGVSLVVLWMVAIFYLSSQPAVESKEVSGGVMDFLVKIIAFISPATAQGDGILGLHFFVRKSAHFFAYFLLGILVLHTLKKIGLKNFKALILAFVICVLYAMVDELHQTFVPGRSGEIRDVIIDSWGGLTGILIYTAINNLKKRINSKTKNQD